MSGVGLSALAPDLTGSRSSGRRPNTCERAAQVKSWAFIVGSWGGVKSWAFVVGSWGGAAHSGPDSTRPH